MKYFVKTTGEEISIGDVIVKKKSINKDGLLVNITTQFLVTEATLPNLIKKGIVVQKEEKDITKISIKAAIVHFAKRTGMEPKDAFALFNTLEKVAPNARFSMLLYEMALMTDEFYKDHILDREKVYAYGNVKNEVLEIPVKDIKNKSIALFRTPEAVEATVKLINGK